MNCENLREHYDLYALGIAEEPERSEIRARVHRGQEPARAGGRLSLHRHELQGAVHAS